MAMVILRTEKLKSVGNWAGSLAHTYRTRETPNAVPERFAANTLESSPQEVLAALKALLPEKRRKDAVLGIEYFIGASPEWFEGRSKDDQDKYFKDARAWLEQRHGAENVLDFSIHRDETSPHAVAYVVPMVDGKLNAKRFLGGRATLSAMQTDFASKVGRRHQLERGLEGSRAHHTTIKDYYARVGSQTPKTPDIDVPEPSMRDRLKPSEYGQKVAESVLAQIASEWNAVQSKARELESIKKRVPELESAARKAQSQAKAERERADKLADLAELFSPAEIAAARSRKAERDKAEAAQKQLAERAAKKQKRIEALPGLRRKTAGAAHTFVEHALRAIEQAGGPDKVEWPKVEGSAARESISQHGQDPQAVARAICEHSPIRTHPATHAKVTAWVQEKAPAWQQHYEAQPGRSKGKGMER